jgi:hypothetical protein
MSDLFISFKSNHIPVADWNTRVIGICIIFGSFVGMLTYTADLVEFFPREDLFV